MVLKRFWKRSEDSKDGVNYTDTLSIWDGGSVIYERLSDGTERSWKVLEREQCATGFTETLLEMPQYNTPIGIVWKEIIPARLLPGGGFQIPGWSVTSQR